LDHETIAVFEGAQQHAASYPGDFVCAVLRLGTKIAQRNTGLPRKANPSRDQAGVLRSERHAYPGLADIGRAIAATIASTPTILQGAGEARRSVRASLLDTADGLLAPAGNVVAHRDARREHAAAHRPSRG
jgi:hypothetical protein